MPRQQVLRGVVVLTFVAAAVALPLAADPGDAVAPTKIVVGSAAKDEILTQGRTYTFTPADTNIGLVRSGSFVFFARGGDPPAVFDVRFDVRDVGRYNGDFIKGRAYEGTIGQALAGSPKGPYLSASIDGRGCNDDKNTTGRFEIQDYQWQKVYLPKGTKVGDPAVELPDDRLVSFAITRFQATFELRCNGETSAMTGTVDFYGEKSPVPEFAVEFIGPTEPCFDPLLVSSSTPGCSGTPAAGTPGDGGAGGGTTFPTLPPPPPPPDVRIVLPPSLVDLPSLQLANNSSTAFKFNTAPISGAVGGDVQLTVETDANEGDGFTATVTPSSIAAPGAGEATLTIGVGPNTFPRDYRVTLIASANGKFAATSFVVTVQCDPPMILGVDQPANQRVTRGSTASVTVKATGSGPFAYQWYSGRRGNTRSPVAAATGATFTTPAVNGDQSYWVRVSNACGSVDSNSVSVAPR